MRTDPPSSNVTDTGRSDASEDVTDASYATSGPPAAATAASTRVTRQVPTKSGGCRLSMPCEPRASESRLLSFISHSAKSTLTLEKSGLA